MLTCRKHDGVTTTPGKTMLGASLGVLALALLGAGARADDAAPPGDGGIPAMAKKVESFSASKIPAARTIAKKIGIATDPVEPADFVVNARPAGEEDYIPIGRKESEHAVKVKTPAELKALEADFDAVKVRHDALRSTFAPAAKAVAAAEAAKAAKGAKKRPAAEPAGAR